MLKGRHFISLADFTKEEVTHLLKVARKLKAEQKDGTQHHLLKGKTLAMIFQKPSNRTRISFEVGMFQLGGQALNIRPTEIEMGKRESIPDVSRVMSRYVDAVMLRVLKHSDISEFARHSTVPVINGLSDLYHPCQALADVMTMEEHLGSLAGKKLCYIGDGNNVANSLILASTLLDIEFCISCPKGYEPTLAARQGVFSTIPDPEEAIRGADAVYTDVWTSMGQEEEHLQRLRAFDGYTITRQLMSLAKPKAIFMHCLPAHRGEEVEAAVVDGQQSVIFDQAENRLHAQKALLAELVVG